jgi:hypothetical protein
MNENANEPARDLTKREVFVLEAMAALIQTLGVTKNEADIADACDLALTWADRMLERLS